MSRRKKSSTTNAPADKAEKSGPAEKIDTDQASASHPDTTTKTSNMLLRGARLLARRGAEKAFLSSKYSKQMAREAVENRSLVNMIATYGIAKVATRSVPGALLVGGGLVAKALFDRSEARRARKRRQRSDDPQN